MAEEQKAMTKKEYCDMITQNLTKTLGLAAAHGGLIASMLYEQTKRADELAAENEKLKDTIEKLMMKHQLFPEEK